MNDETTVECGETIYEIKRFKPLTETVNEVDDWMSSGRELQRNSSLIDLRFEIWVLKDLYL